MGTNTDTDDDQRTSLPRRLTLLLRTAPSVRKSDPNTRTRDNEKKSTMVTSRKTRSLSVATLGVALLLGASRAAALPIELAPEMSDTMAGNLTVGNMTEIANDTIADDENLDPGFSPGRRSLQRLQPPIELAPEMNDTIAKDENLDPGFSPGRRSLAKSSFKRIGKKFIKITKNVGKGYQRVPGVERDRWGWGRRSL